MKRVDLKSITTTSWIKLFVYELLLLLFSIWTGCFWLFFVLTLFLVDCYITKLIPWRWWEKSNSRALKWWMRLVEDIVFILISVHLLNILFFQQFQIPTSSLEKTNLVGDHLFVSKLSYGPRLPMTPIAFPLFHNQFPIIHTKTYLEYPKCRYRRLSGLGKVKRNDIVVFNFPAGDTIATKVTNPDYYTLIHQFGRERLWSDKHNFGDIVARPVDMRDHYVKRVVGMPNDTLELRENVLYINGKKQSFPKESQLNYFIQVTGGVLSNEELDHLGISMDDRTLLDGSEEGYFRLYDRLGFKPDTITNSYGLIYHFPLTQKMHHYFEKHSQVKSIVVEPTPSVNDFPTYPLVLDNGWTRDNFGPLWIPKKGTTISLTPSNLPYYERCIRNFEGHTLEKRGTQIFIDGKEVNSYTFSMDYYFMMGDNRHNSADSRAWGFVPEDHIVGKPLFIWLSYNKDKSLFNGKIRWERLFKVPE